VPDFVPAHLTLNNVDLHGIMDGIDHYGRTVALYGRGIVRGGPLIDRVIPAADVLDGFRAMERRELSRPKILLEFAGEAAA